MNRGEARHPTVAAAVSLPAIPLVAPPSLTRPHPLVTNADVHVPCRRPRATALTTGWTTPSAVFLRGVMILG
jgi:hypothetical protein